MLNYLIILVVYSYVSDIRAVPLKMPNKSLVGEWARSLSLNLKNDFQTASGLTFLTEAYNNMNVYAQDKNYFDLKFEKVDPNEIVKDMAEKLSLMLASKMEALNRSVDAAEKAASEYVWNPKIKKENVDYVSSKRLMENNTRLVYNERFKQKILTDNSSVHIPVEIYDGDVEILNGLKWSEALDLVFKENFDKDPEILWQYFGSQTGFMRTFPGNRWNFGSKEVDLYDVRRRPWYTQGSSSPKDMMIVIDKSGSVQGQALELIKVTVKSLLDTLGENDFVNIVKFSKEAKIVTNCFNNTFVQANFRNKRILINDVDAIEAESMADFKQGLSFAFEQFIKLKNETEGRRGANCNRMIMLLTDGGTDLAEDVFKKYNPKENKTYRVFTYAVGPTANPVSAIRWMACANRGYFSQIPAMGAIRSKVQEYMKKPVQAMETYDLSFSERLRFSIKHDPMGLGMMTTVTLPVYNRTYGSLNQTILGVMGIDVTTGEMLKRAPLRKFGPNGFPFAINSNGYVVFHPNLRVQKDLKDPPNVDFLEVEVESPEKEELRKAMIDQETGNVDMNTYTISQDQRHLDQETGDRMRRYSYTGIGNTTFSLGVSLPMYHQHHLVVNIPPGIKALLDHMKEMAKKNPEMEDLLNDTNTAMLIADWDYYTNFSGNGTILDLVQALENPDNYEWNHELINHLLWDLNVTSFFNQFWTASKHNPELAKGMIGAFVGTNGGLTRLYPKSEDLLDMFVDKRDTWKANYFKRSIDSPQYLFSTPYLLDSESQGNGTVGDVTIVKSITVNNPSFGGPDLKYKAAVVGAVFTHKRIKERMENITKVLNYRSVYYDCSLPNQLGCYLLDDGAFVIATNQEQYYPNVGSFFGRVDPEIMKELNSSVYNRLEHQDYQATCPSESADDQTTGAGTLSFNIPSMTLFYEFLTFNWWTSAVTWTFTNLNLYNMMFSSTSNQAEAYVHPEKTKSCIKTHAQYYFNSNNAEGRTECKIRNIDCSRDFVAVQVEETNLLLVVVEAEKEGCEDCKKKIDKNDLIQEPVESKTNICSIKPRYRRATEKCYDHDAREDDTKCAGSLTHPISFLVSSVVTMATTILILR